ncbi:MAG TPA: cellulase family glycosylhydrolase [Pyrinomonadaceae bacterium]|nr:cellulase family glycosylhydrolase [Pyrinomonadaceae bacterium]
MSRNLIAALLALILFTTTSVAGIRSPGKYAGIVIFDRWDTCYLYSGVYLMYVSNKTKERLRRYEGKSILIYAKEVYQPINPGDGLIGKFKFLGLAKNKWANLERLSLTVEPHFEDNSRPTLVLVIHNDGAKPIYVSPGALAATLLGRKRENLFSPSDGKSDAWLTRSPFKMPSFLKEIGFAPKSDKSHPITSTGEYYLNVEQELPDRFEIPSNGQTTISISFQLPSGEYDFLCGYGGGVHEQKGIASNLVSFSIDEKGRAIVDRVAHHIGLKSNSSKIKFWNEQRKGANWFNITPTREWLVAAKEAGIDVVRLAPNNWKSQQRDFLIGSADRFEGIVEQDYQKLKEVLDQADSLGLKVVITTLSLPGARYRQANDDKLDFRLWRDPQYLPQAILFWRQLAQRLKNHPAIVGYNILNEPVPEKAAGLREIRTQDLTAWYAKVENTPADLNLFNAKIVAAIREVDKETPIVIDCGWWATAYAIQYLEPLRDDKVLYSVHMYEPYSYTNRKTNNGRFSYPGKVLLGIDAEVKRKKSS